MPAQSDTAIEKSRKEVAREYRRQKYRVIQPGAAVALPAFLLDYHPDLIAERDDDRVVIIIKPAHALEGSNELKELAARVADQPGWRLELIALASEGDDAAPLREPDWLESMLEKPGIASDSTVQVVYLTEVLSYLVRGLASLNKIKIRDKSTQRIARELTFAGVLPQELLDRVEDALERRNRLVHLLPPDSGSPTDQADDIIALCREIRTEYMHDALQSARQEARPA
ncbi:MAG: hypothetical protein JOY66_08645 [Acetobacteraceae bacterium]|nr:hypothetical protein [Acetobacteraceae bacterium]